MDETQRIEFPQKIMKSSFYPIFLEYLKKTAERDYGGQASLGRILDVKKAAFHKNITGQSIPNADEFCSWIEKLGGAIFLPGEAPASCNDAEYNSLREQITTLRELVEAKEQIIRLMIDKK